MIHSLRGRLLLGTGGGALLVLAICGWLLDRMLARSLQVDFDARLLDEARTIATLIEFEEGEVHSAMADHEFPQFQPSPRSAAWQIWRTADNRLLGSSAGSAPSMPQPTVASTTPAFGDQAFDDGRPGRRVWFTLVPVIEPPDPEDDEPPETVEAGEPPEVTLVLARDTLDLQAIQAKVRRMLGLVFAVMTALILATLLVVTRRTLASLRELASTLNRIDSRELPTLEIAGGTTEVQTVVDRLNGLIGRLKLAMQKEREFTANVAHELRTPLAGMRSQIEVALLSPRDPAAYVETLRRCAEANAQTEAIVTELLRLARIDAGLEVARCEEFRLDKLLEDIAREFSPIARTAGRTVAWQVDAPLNIVSDEGKVRVIVLNLLSNAVEYSQGPGPVEVSAACENGVARLVVANPCKPFANGDLDRIFNRLWRGDEARGATGVHAGLGLAICRELAHSMRATLTASCPRPGRFEIRLELPEKK